MNEERSVVVESWVKSIEGRREGTQLSPVVARHCEISAGEFCVAFVATT